MVTVEAYLLVKAKAIFDDEESNENTVRYLVEQDLEDVGYDVEVSLQSKSEDVAPVKHGKWEYHSGGNSLIYAMNPEDAYCSVCGFHVDTTEVDFDGYKFCPNCGADMRGN